MTRTVAYRARRKRARDKRNHVREAMTIFFVDRATAIAMVNELQRARPLRANPYRAVRQLQRMLPNADLHL